MHRATASERTKKAKDKMKEAERKHGEEKERDICFKGFSIVC